MQFQLNYTDLCRTFLTVKVCTNIDLHYGSITYYNTVGICIDMYSVLQTTQGLLMFLPRNFLSGELYNGAPSIRSSLSSIRPPCIGKEVGVGKKAVRRSERRGADYAMVEWGTQISAIVISSDRWKGVDTRRSSCGVKSRSRAA